jgi:hypothetical protein
MRKACVEIIVEITRRAPREQKEKELTELMLNLLSDVSRQVKISAYKVLGPFIIELQGCNLNEDLLKNFLAMSDQSINYLSQDHEVICFCRVGVNFLYLCRSSYERERDIINLILIFPNCKQIMACCA